MFSVHVASSSWKLENSNKKIHWQICSIYLLCTCTHNAVKDLWVSCN